MLLLLYLLSTGYAGPRPSPVTDDVPNPDRGLNTTLTRDAARERAAASPQAQGVVQYNLDLGGFCTRSLPDDALARLAADLDAHRAVGATVLFRAAYTFGRDSARWDPCRKARRLADRDTRRDVGNPATIDVALTHIHQLAPILNRYVDVVAVVQTGMLGLWGEGHHGPRAASVEAVDRVVQALGEARPETLSPGNDRHPGATGDSLRDAVDVWWLHDDAILASLTPELALLLEGPGRRAALTDAIAAAHASGAVDDLGPSLRWLTEVDPQGRPLGTGDPSALARMVRVLALTNQPVECELGLGPVGVSWSFDNLAVRLLELVARLDDDAIDSAGSLFSALTGGPVSDSLLRAAVATGTCPATTTETLDDLDAVALLFTADAAATRIVAVEVLRALPTGALPTVADALETVWLGGGMAPLEELLRDVGHTPGVGGLARLLGVLARDDAPTVQALLALVHQLSIDPARRDRLDHLGRVLLGPDASWEAIDRLAVLVAHPDSRSAELPSLARAVLAADPDLALLEPLRALLVEESVVRPLLEAARAPRVVEAVLPATSSPDAPAPLVWLAPQLVDGTIADLVELVSRVLVAAGVSPEPTQRRAP